MASGAEAPDAARDDTIRVAVAATPAPGEAFEVELAVPSGSTVAQVLLRARVSAEGPVGIWGRAVDPDAPVVAGDRIEIYRPLPVDAKEARRRRAAEQRKAAIAARAAGTAGGRRGR